MRNSTIDYYNKNAQTYFSNTVRLDGTNSINLS